MLKSRRIYTHEFHQDGTDKEVIVRKLSLADVCGFDGWLTKIFTMINCVQCKLERCCAAFTTWLADRACSIVQATSNDTATDLHASSVYVKWSESTTHCEDKYEYLPNGSYRIVNASPEKRYRIHSRLEVLGNATGLAINQKLNVNFTTLSPIATSPVMTAGVPVSFSLEHILTGYSGPVTVRVQTNSVAGTGIVNVVNNASTFYIEEI